MSNTIKFGTDGWRAIIADQYTFQNVERVAIATAQWVKNSGGKRVVVGYDCRFLGREFAERTSQVLAESGLEVVLSSTTASTPAVSLAITLESAFAGVVITASHNPPNYNGFKVKASYGGPANPQAISDIEGLIPSESSLDFKALDQYESDGIIQQKDLDEMYCNRVRTSFDVDALNASKFHLAYDAMYGAGQQVMKRLFPLIQYLHAENNPGFNGQAPEPIHKNLSELSSLTQSRPEIDLGLATDGDADRLGLYDEDGNFVDSHHIILLLIAYLVQEEGLSGKVVNSFSCSSRITRLCEHFGLEQDITKIGFKYICDIMVNDDVLIGGEESGGIAIKNHIPERDGIWVGLTIWQYMTKTGKSLKQLIADVYEIVGSFSVQRYDLHITNELKTSIVAQCKERGYTRFGQYEILGVDDKDGFKHDLGNGQWVLIRPSGTEPVLRVYAEADTEQEAFNILDATKKAILG
jgi:phosphomannomutase